MAFENLPPDVRNRLIDTGRDFGSDRTYAQGTETFGHATGENADVLRQFGLGAGPVNRLKLALDTQKELGAERDDARTGEGVATRERHDAERDGKVARATGVAVLSSASSELLFVGDQESANKVDQVLHQVGNGSGSHLPTLSSHLGLLAGVLAVAPVAAVVAGSGGPEAAQQVADAKAKVDDAIARGRTNASHTPEETERLDLLDGIIIEVCRQARKAARAASKALGRPALARLFELDALYGRRSASTEEPKVA